MATPADEESGVKGFLFQYLQHMDDMYSKSAGRMWGWTDEMGLALCSHYFKWLMDNGQYYERDDERMNELLETSYYQPELKQCYQNSLFMMQEDGVGYCEGYMISSSLPIPIEHAWNVVDGKVVDFTSSLWDWKADDEKRIYFGVEMPKRWALGKMNELMITGPYLKHFVYEQLKG